jgi:CBS domain-containing protein
MPTCSDVMTRPLVYCQPGDSVTEAAELMRRHDLGSLPVVDGDDARLVGMLTDRDLVLKVVAGDRAVDTVTVREAMTANPSSCRDDEDAAGAMAMMAARQMGQVPVVDAGGRLVGIIARGDAGPAAPPPDRS